MEKLLLVMALLGSAHLALGTLAKVGKRVVSFAKKPRRSDVLRREVVCRDVVRMPASPIAVHKEGEDDWSRYDKPTFIRRGSPMPKLERNEGKGVTKARKRRGKAKAEGSVARVMSDAASFEIVA
jgi:hypothetical protein